MIAQYHEVAELAEATGRKMYVDPSIYASADEAVRDFAREIPPKFLSMKEEIGRGKSLNIWRMNICYYIKTTDLSRQSIPLSQLMPTIVLVYKAVTCSLFYTGAYS